MAKLYITNDKEMAVHLRSLFVAAGFSNYEEHDAGGLFIAAFKKKRHPLPNMYVNARDGGVVVAVGTCVFNGKVGREALEDMYVAFAGSVRDMRKRALGNYCVVIVKSGHCCVFTDKYHTIKTYVREGLGGKYAIANSLYALAHVPGPAAVDTDALVEESFLVASVGQRTPFRDIRQLFGYECLRVTASSIETVPVPIESDFAYVKGLGFEEMVEDFSGLVKEEVHYISSHWGESVGLHQTGGLDNRTVFAALMNAGCRPRTFYGVGNTVLTNTKHGDREIVRAYAARFHLDLHEMDWSHDFVQDVANWGSLVDRYGFLYALYGGSQRFFHEYETVIQPLPAFMECGYFGEVLRQREWAYLRREAKSEYTLQEFVNGYLLGGGYGDFGNVRFAREFHRLPAQVLESYRMQLQANGITLEEGEKFGLDLWNKVEWVHMRNANSLVLNFLNDFTSSFAFFSTERLHDFALEVPAEFLQHARFQLAVIRRLFPDALEVPIWSHGMVQDYNKDTGMLTAKVGQSGRTMKALVLSLVRAYTPSLIPRLQTLRLGRNSDRELRQYLDALMLENAMGIMAVEPGRYRGSLTYYANLLQYMYAIQRCRRAAASTSC